MERRIKVSEIAAYFYLIGPLLIFSITFLRIEIAVPSTIFILIVSWTLLRRTDWTVGVGGLGKLVFFTLLSCAIVALVGFGNLVPFTGDWIKHFAIMNVLADAPWPPIEGKYDGSLEVLRYSIGYYLVPASVVAALPIVSAELALALWTAIGLIITFHLVSNFAGVGAAAIFSPLLFILFSGADWIGTAITGFQINPFHLEWWPGWMQFSAPWTLFSWTPQHALPAWMIVSLTLIAFRMERPFALIAVPAASLILWSPFAAVGYLPIGLAFILHRQSIHSLFAWPTIGAAFLIALPAAFYVSADASSLPQGAIWSGPCVINSAYPEAPCFSWMSYVLTVAIEVGLWLTVAFFICRRWRPLLAVCAFTLMLLPLYRFGEWNDLVMRASGPAIAVLAILLSRAIFFDRSARWLAVGLWIAGAPTVAYEIAAKFNWESPSMALSTFDDVPIEYRSQYFADAPLTVLREPSGIERALSQVLCQDFYDFTSEGNVERSGLVGFSMAEPHGRWSTTTRPAFHCFLPADRPASILRFAASAFVYEGNPQIVRVAINGRDSFETVFNDPNELRTFELPLPDELSGEMRLTFDIPDAISPREIGISGDGRKLGIAIRYVCVDDGSQACPRSD